MSNVLQNSIRYVPKQSKYTLGLTFVLGAIIALSYFGTPILQKSCNYLNNNITSSKSFNIALSTTVDSTLPILCMVTRIYWAQLTYFPLFALALYHNGLHNIRIYTINTDNQTNIEQLKQTINFINDLVLQQNFVLLLDLGEPSTKNDFGYGMTDRAIDYLYKQHTNSSSSCQYVTFTNGDNFYSRNFAKKILPHMKSGKDIIGWSFVSHHYKPHYKESIDSRKKTVPEVVDDGTEKCTPVELRAGYADLGAVAYRFLFLKQHNLYFGGPNRGYSFGSDGYFVEQAARRTSTSVILKQTLFVHQ